MKKVGQKNARRLRRRRHIRRKLAGDEGRPRLSVFRSNKHIYAQVINDETGATLAAASSRSKEARESLGDKSGAGGNRAAAKFVGTLLAERAKAAGVERVVFDRGGYKFHGRVKEFAEAAREGGLKF